MALNKSFGMIKAGNTFTNKVNVGTEIWFKEEKQKYTVRASNRFYSVCTKPFNVKKTVLYTVIDWHNQIRGAEDLIFAQGAENEQKCKEMLERITNVESNISSRNYCQLQINKIKHNSKN